MLFITRNVITCTPKRLLLLLLLLHQNKKGKLSKIGIYLRRNMWQCYKNLRGFNQKLRKEGKFGKSFLNCVWRNVASMKSVKLGMAECGIHEECLTLKMKSLRLFEAQLNVCQSRRRNVPDDLNLQQYRCGNLESCTSRLFVRLILPNAIRDIVCRLAILITFHLLQLSSNSVFFSN
jgi:hypothetical protein